MIERYLFILLLSITRIYAGLFRFSLVKEIVLSTDSIHFSFKAQAEIGDRMNKVVCRDDKL